MHRLACGLFAIVPLVLLDQSFAAEARMERAQHQLELAAAAAEAPAKGDASATAGSAGRTQAAGPQLAEGPTREQLEARFQIMLPGYWKLANFSVVASANYGTAVEPVIKQRFTTQIALREDTFVLDTKEDQITWIAPVAEAGDAHTVYGIATSKLHAGTWQAEFNLENDPMSGVGQPRHFFDGRVIVRGGEEEERHLAELAAQRDAEAERAHQEELARHKREEELRQQERQAELARIAHQERVTEEERKQREREAAAQEAKKRKGIAQLTENARNRLAVDLPGYWQITTFEPGDVTWSMDSNKVLMAREFKATVKLAEDTFAKVEEDAPVVIVAPVAQAGTTRDLYGVLRVRVRAESGEWSTDAEFEEPELDGAPIADSGQPLGSFGGRAIVRGSSEEEAYRQAKLPAELAERQRQQALEEQERQAELARQAAAEKKREQERQAELARLGYERRLKEEKHKVELARTAFEVELRKRQEEKEAAMRAARARELAAFRAALASDDIGERTRAVEQALAGDDETMRLAALRSALESGDEALQRTALLEVLSRTKTIGGTYHTQNKTDERAFAIRVNGGLNVQDGLANFTGHFAGAAIHDAMKREPAAGTLSGLVLRIANEDCSLSATLGADSAMEGEMACLVAYDDEGRMDNMTVDVTIPIF